MLLAMDCVREQKAIGMRCCRNSQKASMWPSVCVLCLIRLSKQLNADPRPLLQFWPASIVHEEDALLCHLQDSRTANILADLVESLTVYCHLNVMALMVANGY